MIIDKKGKSETFITRNNFGYMPGSRMEPIYCIKQIVRSAMKRIGTCIWY